MADLGQLRRAGVKVHRHRHRARRHTRGAAQPDAREEHIGQRGQAAQIQRTRRGVAHPQAREAVAGAAVPGVGDRTVKGPHLVAPDPLDRRRHGIRRQLGRWGHGGHGFIVHAPGLAARGGDHTGGGHGRRIALCVRLREGQHPVLCGAVGTHRLRAHGEGSVGHRRAEIHRQRQRFAQQGRVLQHRVQQGGGGDAAERAHHVGVGRRGGAGVTAVAGGGERDGPVKDVWMHRASVPAPTVARSPARDREGIRPVRRCRLRPAPCPRTS